MVKTEAPPSALSLLRCEAALRQVQCAGSRGHRGSKEMQRERAEAAVVGSELQAEVVGPRLQGNAASRGSGWSRGPAESGSGQRAAKRDRAKAASTGQR